MTPQDRIDWIAQHESNIEWLNKQIEELQIELTQHQVAIQEAKKAIPPLLVAMREAEKAYGEAATKIDKAEYAYLRCSRSLASTVQDRTRAGIKLDKLRGALPHYAGDDLRP